MDSISLLADNVTPPVGGQVLVITLDTTSREYDLSGLSFAGRDSRENSKVYLRLHSDGADTFFFFSDTSGLTVSETAAVSAGGTPAFTANAAQRIPGDQERDVIITQKEHRYLYVKGSAAGYLRINATSCRIPG